MPGKLQKGNTYFTTLLLCLFFTCFASAQTGKKDSTSTEKTSYFKFSAGYLSNAVYNGRKDSLTTTYISPSLGYYDKSGFYLTTGVSYLASAGQHRIDLFSVDAGYDFDFSDKFSGSVYANKSFYNQSSTSIKSDIKGSGGFTLGYDLDFIQLSAGADLLIAQKPDIGLNFGLAHAFSFGEQNNVFSLTPSIVANMSTLHFYEGFTSRKAGKKATQTNPNAASIATTTTVNNNKLTLLDYELSIPLSYDAKKIGFFLTPTFAIPKNPIYTTTVTTVKLRSGVQSSVTQDSTPQTEKNLENIFYLEFGAYLKF